jgi:hypothetical protein
MPHPAVALLAAVVLAATPVHGQAPDPPRAFLVIVDDLHIDVRSTPRLRKLLQDLAKGARNDDTWALVTTGSSGIRLEPAPGGADLRAAVSRVTGSSLKVREELDAFGDADRTAIVRRRALVTDILIAQAVSQTAQRRGGPLSILYLTDGYDARMVPAMSETVRAAAEARAQLVAVSVRDLVTGSTPASDVRPDEWTAYVEATRQSLRTLAEQTGGIAVFSREELDAVFASLSQPQR